MARLARAEIFDPAKIVAVTPHRKNGPLLLAHGGR